jgi:hypothetical protein
MKRLANLANQPKPYGVVKQGPQAIATAWDFSDEACSGKIVGLLTHGQVRKDKDDMHPQQNLIDMLMSL